MLPALAQPAIQSHAVYAAPFRERLPNGELGPEYGPVSPAAQAAQTARLRDWSFQPPVRTDQRKSKLSAVLEPAGGVRGVDLSPQERRVLDLIVGGGHSIRWVAKYLGLRRDTVRTYVARIKAKAGLDK